MSPEPAAAAATRRPRWPWAALGAALAWVALVRVPVVAHAAEHLDSDLAVDGLTLLDAVNGRWRWHFPGTPGMGIGPLLLAYPQARAWGATPATLVSGGVAAYLLVVLATFLLARRAFGPIVAGWSLVPLAFASTGTVWLSARLTGGHLATVALHALAFERLHAALTRGGAARAVGLGLVCGLGLFTDRMFAFTIGGVVVGTAAAWRSVRGREVVAFALGALVGFAPAEIGRRVDPHDGYREQLAPLLVGSVVAEHGRLLALDCLPRLIAGHRLPGLQSEPSPATVGARPSAVGSRRGDALDATTAGVALTLFSAALVALAFGPARGGEPAGRAVRAGLLAASAALVAAFVVNRNIFNSDNYRYLVIMLVPWAVGFGLLCDRLGALGRGGVGAAGVAAFVLAALMTVDNARWYDGFGWLGEPARRARREPWLERIDREPAVTHVFGDYWDVYRLAFLSGGRAEGVPYPIYPNRFPGWSRGLGPGRGRLLLVRPRADWPDMLRGAWRDDGRDVGELPRVPIDGDGP